MPKFKTHGKWILAGEHSVLRGGHALVFPVRSKFLLFEHIEEDQDFQLNIKNENRDFEMAFWGVLEKALHRVGHKRSDLKGELFLNSNIPVGAGMGASATLCVSLAKWFCSLGWLDEEEQYEFAKGLEDIFHGESSGVDVAVALRNQALEFQRPHSMESFMPIWQPHLYLSFCGKRGVTADCVRQVQKLWQTDEKKARQIDQRMEQAVQMAKQALLEKNNLSLLVEGIQRANQCFQDWDLISRDLEVHSKALIDKGALVTKPTGSGGGGFVISLWDKIPNASDFPFELIET